MKRFMGQLTRVILMVTISTAFVSCMKDDINEKSTASEGTITAQVDGKKITTLKIATFASLSRNVLIIQGNTGGTEAKAIVLTIVGEKGTGTYPINGINSASYEEFKIDINNPANPGITLWTSPYGGDGQTGEISITEITDTHVVGTFSFEAGQLDDDENVISKVNVKSGSFNVKLTN